MNKFKQVFYILLLLALLSAITACGGGAAGGDSANNAGGSSGSGGSNGGTIPIGSHSVTLNWTAPDSYTDGSYLSDLQGHHIYMKINDGSYARIHTINSPGLLTHYVDSLDSGTYTFAVTAFNSEGLESSFSNAIRITL